MSDNLIDLLAAQLDALWDGERVEWKVEYIASSYGSPAYWIVWLNSHDDPTFTGADEGTLTWRWENENLVGALADAVAWCEELAPWKPCGECDGQGAWNGEPCEPCHATGLYNAAYEALADGVMS